MGQAAGQAPHTLEATAILADGSVYHYTCNPPSQVVLDKNKIRCMGIELGCRDDREVLIIPAATYKRHGYDIRPASIQATSEYLMRRLGRN